MTHEEWVEKALIALLEAELITRDGKGHIVPIHDSPQTMFFIGYPNAVEMTRFAMNAYQEQNMQLRKNPQ